MRTLVGSFVAGSLAAVCVASLAAEHSMKSPQSSASVATTTPPVFDVHFHVPPRPIDLAQWLEEMDSLNVSHAIALRTPAQLDEFRVGRFLPSLTLPCEGGLMTNSNARCFEDGSTFPPVSLVRQLATSGRIRAIGEVTAQYMGVAPDDPRMEPYYTIAEELDLPFGIHLGIGAPGIAYPGPGFPPRKSPNYSGRAGNPLLLEGVLVRHPKLRLYAMHAAWPFLSEMTYMLYMHPQLYVDVSVLQWAVPRPAYYSYLKSLVDAGFSSRIMFGSDGGVKHLRIGVDAIMNAEFLTAQQKRDILYNNAGKFFRVSQ